MSCSSHAHGLAYQRVSCRFFITLFLLPWASTPIIPPVSGGRTLRITSSIAAAMGTFWHKFQKSVPYYIIYTGTMELFTFDNFFLNLYLVLHAGMHVMHYKVFLSLFFICTWYFMRACTSCATQCLMKVSPCLYIYTYTFIPTAYMKYVCA